MNIKKTIKNFFKNKKEDQLSTYRLLFDDEWYINQYPEALGLDPFEHYINIGVTKGYNPNPLFDTNYYIQQSPELLKTGQNPLFDYVLNYSSTLKNPHPYFNTSFYLKQNSDVAADGINPLLHYLKYGMKEGRLGKKLEPIAETKLLREKISSVGFKAETKLTEIIFNLNNVKNYISLNRHNNDEVLYLNEKNDAFGINDEINYPKSTYIAKLNNVLFIAGSRYIIADNNEILHDEEFHFKNSTDADVKYKNANREKNNKLKLDFKTRQAAWLENGINLMHEYNNNYFHFIVETLPRMLLCEEISIPNHIPFIFESNLHPNIITLIALINTSKRPVIYLPPDYIYSIKEMYYVSDVSSIIDSYSNGEENKLSVLSINNIVKIKNRCLEHFSEQQNKKPFRKIYVKRTGDYRNLVNQNEIEEALKQFGFEIIDTSFLSVESQIQIFNEASFVITPTGAQVTNIVWCQNNIKVIILFSDHPSHQHYLWEILGKANNLSVNINAGLSTTSNDTLYGVHNDYSINVDELINFYKKIS